jgi:hypothetical protein
VLAAGLTYAVMEYVCFGNPLVHAFTASFIFLALSMVFSPTTGAVTQQDIQRGFRGYFLLAPFLDLEERIIQLFQRITM